ncbi:helicase-related protein [Myxococcota bacterium]
MTTMGATSFPPLAERWTPGSLVRARGREWIVLSGSDGEVIRVRPVSGTEDDQTLIHLALEADPVVAASFPLPEPTDDAGQDDALLLRDALVLSLRRGAGPLRSLGQIAVEPRAYQLVPLLMALKLDPVRLLVADDVGVGKTIEAALIARELLDRGDIERFTVLCPPHLVEQWVTELDSRFHWQTVAVTAMGASRLERDLPPSESLFEAYPYTVVSLDYIQSERRRAEFLRACPELVLVDEAHTCAATGRGRHQRYELLRGLAESPTRHLIMLTATPHSGDERTFYRLLGLLERDFERLSDATGDERAELRVRLARHFVQRRRLDLAEWQESGLFPRRETQELTYRLTGEWEGFSDAVLGYCRSVAEATAEDEGGRRLSFWAALALLRCVASSPAAAAQALRTRAGVGREGVPEEPEAPGRHCAAHALSSEMRAQEELEVRVFDGAADALPDDDVEPPAATDALELDTLMAQAESLVGQTSDPKLKLLTVHLRELIASGFNPVVFCRYIATAHYLSRSLAGKLGNVAVGVVTGELTSDERREQVDALGEAERRILIATDCLSEGVNLQDHFDAVVHYDLSWNPTRHEQREGRVDRFGQKSAVVRTALMYGVNNPVDGAVLETILRKAEKIRLDWGVPVPLPDDGHGLSQALVRAILLGKAEQNRRELGVAVPSPDDGHTSGPALAQGSLPRQREPGAKRQAGLAIGELAEAQAIDARWRDAAETAKKNRTVFAQRRLRPEEVLPEWRKSLAALGGREDVQRFASRALARMGAALEPLRRGFRAPLGDLPEDIRERLETEGLSGTVLVDFEYPPAPRCRAVQRGHPLISVLAETLLERTLGGASEDASADSVALGRVGCWVSETAVSRTVALLRLRHQLTSRRAGGTSTVLVEEATAFAWGGATAILEGEEALAPAGGVATLEEDEALRLLALPPVTVPPLNVRQRAVRQALASLATRRNDLDSYAERRAQVLLADHRRVREAADARGSYRVRALLPADVIGLFVLLPADFGRWRTPRSAHRGHPDRRIADT